MKHEYVRAHRARNQGDSLNDLCTELLVVRSLVLVEASQQEIQSFLKELIELFFDHNDSGGKGGDRVLLLDGDTILHKCAKLLRDVLHVRIDKILWGTIHEVCDG